MQSISVSSDLSQVNTPMKESCPARPSRAYYQGSQCTLPPPVLISNFTHKLISISVQLPTIIISTLANTANTTQHYHMTAFPVTIDPLARIILIILNFSSQGSLQRKQSRQGLEDKSLNSRVDSFQGV